MCEDIGKVYEKLGRCLVACSEGVTGPDGKLLIESEASQLLYGMVRQQREIPMETFSSLVLVPLVTSSPAQSKKHSKTNIPAFVYVRTHSVMHNVLSLVPILT